MDETKDDGLEGRVHDAYESVSLSPEAEERILGALLAAQAQREAEESPEPVADAPVLAEVLPGPASRRKSPLRFVLPAAACLVIAVVAGTAALRGGLADGTMESAALTESIEEEAATAPAEEAYELAERDMVTDEAMESHDAGASAEESLDSAKSTGAAWVALDDGEGHELVVEDGRLVEVDSELAGEPVGVGEAWDVAGEPLGTCDVFYPVDESGLAGYWLVRPQGSDVCYLADLAS